MSGGARWKPTSFGKVGSIRLGGGYIVNSTSYLNGCSNGCLLLFCSRLFNFNVPDARCAVDELQFLVMRHVSKLSGGARNRRRRKSLRGVLYPQGPCRQPYGGHPWRSIGATVVQRADESASRCRQ